jgi:predicted nucleotidyltransferase
MTLITDAGRVDILRVLPEVDSFEGLKARAEIRVLGGITVHVASIDDLISMKLAAGRPKDLDHIHHLMAIKKLKPEA